MAASYLDPNAEMTLREGLEQYVSRQETLSPEELSAAARREFLCHDVAHVVFACDLTPEHEELVDAWTVFGTDAGVRDLLRLALQPASLRIFWKVGPVQAVRNALRVRPQLVEVRRRARGMRKKWPWRGFDPHMDRPLVDIRAEFGIRVLRSGCVVMDGSEEENAPSNHVRG